MLISYIIPIYKYNSHVTKTKAFQFYRIFNRWFWIRVIIIWLSANWIRWHLCAYHGRWSILFLLLYKVTVNWYVNLLYKFHFSSTLVVKRVSTMNFSIGLFIIYRWSRARLCGGQSFLTDPFSLAMPLNFNLKISCKTNAHLKCARKSNHFNFRLKIFHFLIIYPTLCQPDSQPVASSSLSLETQRQ